MLAQVPDHLLQADGGPDIGTSAGAAPCAHSGGGEKQVQGGQVRQELILADVGVSSAWPGLVSSRWYVP